MLIPTKAIIAIYAKTLVNLKELIKIWCEWDLILILLFFQSLFILHIQRFSMSHVLFLIFLFCEIFGLASILMFCQFATCLDSCFFCSCHSPWLSKHFMHSYKTNLSTSKFLGSILAFLAML